MKDPMTVDPPEPESHKPEQKKQQADAPPPEQAAPPAANLTPNQKVAMAIQNPPKE